MKSVFSEPDGTGSFARVLSAVLAIAGIVWVSHVVIRTHVIPPLSDLAVFVASPYATNKLVTKITDSIGGNKQQ